jgi:CheY-like chemotaxis protein
MLDRASTLVLLVADSEDDREIYLRGLELAGFGVACSSREVDVVAIARFLSPSVIVLIIDRPERDGWQLCLNLHLERATAHIPVVVLTAAIRPDGANRRMAQRMPNCASFVAKPCDHCLLVSVVERVIGGERAIEEVHWPGNARAT